MIEKIDLGGCYHLPSLAQYTGTDYTEIIRIYGVDTMIVNLLHGGKKLILFTVFEFTVGNL